MKREKNTRKKDSRIDKRRKQGKAIEKLNKNKIKMSN